VPAALAELSAASDTLLWGETQHNLGALLVARANAGDAAAWRNAASVLNEGAATISRARYPARWAMFQAELGAAYRAAGQAHYDEAIAAYEGAIEETNRARSPSLWLAYGTDLARTLIACGDRGDFANAEAMLADVLSQATASQFDSSWEAATLGNAELGPGPAPAIALASKPASPALTQRSRRSNVRSRAGPTQSRRCARCALS